MEHEHNDQDLTGAPYAFFHGEPYGTPMPFAPASHLPYQVVPNAQTADMLQMRQLSLMQHHSQSFQYPPSPTRAAAAMQLPPSPSGDPHNSVYEHPMSPPVSGSDASTDSQTPYHTHAHTYSRESSSGAGSPPSRRSHQHRYNPTSGRRGRRGSTHDDLSDDGEHDPISPQSTGSLSGQALAETLANSRKEATRKQRIEAEQRRRDELREGYARLKDVLPISNQKSSKVSLLERATNYITTLDQTNKIIQTRVHALESEVARLREINERLSITVVQHTGGLPPDLELGLTPQPQYDDANAQVEGRPLSPPPEIQSPQQQQSQQQPQTLQHQQLQPKPELQHEHPRSEMYAHQNDSSASASHASGSEY